MEATIEEAIEAGAIETEVELPAPHRHQEPETPPEPMTQRRVLNLATPIIGENLLQTAVGAVDTFMVARLGAYAVAGVGTGFEIVFFIISILSAIDIGATVLVSQAIGAGEQRRANHLARQAIVWGVLLAIPVSIGMYFASPHIITLVRHRAGRRPRRDNLHADHRRDEPGALAVIRLRCRVAWRGR